MSKKTLALVLTALFVFAFATSAFAAWGDSTYLDPASIAPGGTGTSNPHGPYDATSRKCAVCHAVHNASATGTRLLKAATGSNPCVVCHVSGDAGNIIVYEGQETAYTTASEYAHNNDCGACHTVHGVGYVQVTGAITDNLKGQTSLALEGTTDDSVLDRSAFGAYSVSSTGGDPGSLSKWCSGCHPYYNEAYNGRSHVMTSGDLTDYMIGGAAVGEQVAWVDSASCDKCHDSDAAALADRATTGTMSTAKFPHYTDGARFLNTEGAAPVASGAAGMDGVCRKCHVSGGSGVGLTF